MSRNEILSKDQLYKTESITWNVGKFATDIKASNDVTELEFTISNEILFQIVDEIEQKFMKR